MVTVVASWDARTGESKIHLSLDSMMWPTDIRLETAEAKVHELEKLYEGQSVEVLLAHARTLDDFRKTDPRFYQA